MTRYSTQELARIARQAARDGGLTRGRVTWEILIDPWEDRLQGIRQVTLLAHAQTAMGTPGTVNVAI